MLLPRDVVVVVGAADATVSQEVEIVEAGVTRWGCEVERGRAGDGLLWFIFTFDKSGDVVVGAVGLVGESLVNDVEVVSTLEDLRSSRLISVVERQGVPRLGDLVLRRRWKKLPPFVPWWYPDLRGLLAARKDL